MILPDIGFVLELGSGSYSTPCFLDRLIYPDLDCLLSIEEHATWADLLKRASQDEPRLVWTKCDHGGTAQALREEIEAIDKGQARGRPDLVFVDDSDNPTARVTTLGVVAELFKGSRTMVIVHDADYPEYKAQIDQWDNVYLFDVQTPNTALMWSGPRNFKPQLDRLRELIRECVS
jgi:hypothetical protein